MKILKSPVFILCCVFFVLHQLLQRAAGIGMPLADRYLDSLLAMPIILSLLTAERRLLFRKGSGYHLPLIDVWIATVFVVLVSELLFPALSDRFTADWLDVVLFTLGTVIFILTIRRSEK